MNGLNCSVYLSDKKSCSSMNFTDPFDHGFYSPQLITNTSSIIDLEINVSEDMAILTAELLFYTDESKTCFLECLHERWCTQEFQGGSLHFGWEALFSQFVPLDPWPIHIKLLDFGEAPVHQALSIPKVVMVYIAHSLPMPRHDKAGHAAFLITLTEVILLYPMLSLICT